MNEHHHEIGIVCNKISGNPDLDRVIEDKLFIINSHELLGTLLSYLSIISLMITGLVNFEPFLLNEDETGNDLFVRIYEPARDYYIYLSSFNDIKLRFSLVGNNSYFCENIYPTNVEKYTINGLIDFDVGDSFIYGNVRTYREENLREQDVRYVLTELATYYQDPSYSSSTVAKREIPKNWYAILIKQYTTNANVNYLLYVFESFESVDAILEVCDDHQLNPNSIIGREIMSVDGPIIGYDLLPFTVNNRSRGPKEHP